MTGDRSRQLASAFNLASEGYDSEPMSFFACYGERLAEFSGAATGEAALDICTGTGAVAFPLARRVTATGSVLGVDISSGMLARARSRAKRDGMSWVQFVESDVAEFVPDRVFDLATAGFSVQFFQDMSVPMSKMRDAVEPGGRVAISMWADGFIAAQRDVLLRDHGGIRPDLAQMPRSGSSVKNVEELLALIASSGLDSPECEHVDHKHPLKGASAWWEFLVNAGYRRQISQLTDDELARFRDVHLRSMERMENSAGEIVLDMPASLGRGTVPG